MKKIEMYTPFVILISCILALIIVFNYQVVKLGKQVEKDEHIKDSLQTEMFILQSNNGRYEIFYDVMKEKHPKEVEGIMDSIE